MNNLNTKSSIVLNGFITTPFEIMKDVRQDDLLSLYIFSLAVEQLVSYINGCPTMQGLEIGKAIIKCFSCADDMNLTLYGSYSVKKAYHYVQLFQKALGLILNKSKTQGLMIRPTAL